MLSAARSLPRLSTLALLAAALPLFACGSRTPLLVDEAPADEPLTVAPPPDASAPLAAADADEPLVDSSLTVDAAPPPRLGVLFGSGTLAGLSGPDTAQAYFLPQDDVPAGCAFIGAAGTCSVLTCPTTSGLPASANAGTIVASVGAASASMLYAGTSPTGTYEGANINATFTTGDIMSFHGSGGPDVPPFSVTVVGPELVQLDAPWFFSEVAIDSTQDLPLSWAPSSMGDAIFSVGDAMGNSLVCAFHAGPQAATVPQAQLAALKALVGDAPLNAEFYVATHQLVSVPGWQIQAMAIVWAGATVSQYGAVTLQ